MKSIVPLLLVTAALSQAAPCGGHGTRDSVFVSTSWLADHLKDRNLVVLAVGTEEEYRQEHIPGSQYFTYRDVQAAGAAGSLTLQMPEISVLARNFEKYGVSNSSRVVIYRLNNAATQTARVYVTLDAMGLAPQASILDGNVATWKQEGRATTTAIPNVSPGKLEPCAQNDVITDLDYVKQHLSASAVRIVDARAPEVYSGAQSRAPIAAGHIQGAANIYFNSLFDDHDKLKSPAELEKMFTAAGIHPGDRVVTYCFIGQQASALYAVSRYLGYDTRLYDGSMEEWSKHPDLPVEKSPAR